jgi:hypothetical protein
MHCERCGRNAVYLVVPVGHVSSGVAMCAGRKTATVDATPDRDKPQIRFTALAAHPRLFG